MLQVPKTIEATGRWVVGQKLQRDNQAALVARPNWPATSDVGQSGLIKYRRP